LGGDHEVVFPDTAVSPGECQREQRCPCPGWPTKPIRAIVPFTAGSGTDVIAHVVLDQLSIQFGQSIVVENRTGAGGTIGAAAVAKADPDGYTILVNSSALTIAPSQRNGS
jgi:tripartite-type tricarboxylate transporter receptor subunit TctC